MSKKFIWTKKYSVAVPEIDEQHQEFIKICNDLISLVDNGSFTREEGLLNVMNLGNYASYHLGTEEELFIKTKYPEISSHMEIHNRFRKESKMFINQMRDNNIDTNELIKKIANFSGDWLLNHILTEDKKFFQWFNEHKII